MEPDHKIGEKVGLLPGSLVYVGENNNVPTHITAMQYNKMNFTERNIKEKDFFIREELRHFLHTKGKVGWVNVNGLSDIILMRSFGDSLRLDPLVLEDILNTQQRPKVEVFSDHIFFVLRMLSYDQEKEEVNVEQVSFILGNSFVISFQEREGDVFEMVRVRLRKKWGNLRFRGSDYLLYSLLDMIVDNYFLILECLSHKVAQMEERILSENLDDQNVPAIIQKNKKIILTVQQAVYPLREAINKLQRNESGLIDERTVKFLSDVQDHTLQVTDNIESFRDMNTGLQDVYLSTLSNNLNQVMKILTIISTIFIPLTFIVGLYGMNFKYMPEIGWKYGYLFSWGLMVTVVITLFVFFKRKRWL
ncbi:MAG: magnesium/cobalt transporter CorA [Cytophagales bacterium]|nr:magnesium/cobalt transporter CorA [Cytophagales bacterium]